MATKMTCHRHKAEVEMYRVTNPPGDPNEGTAKARCSKCSLVVDCAYCPKCENTICVKCYNKSIDDKGKPPKIGPSLGETSHI